MTQLHILARFDGSNGASPFSNLTLDPTGNLIGTTAFGGPDGDGTVFSINKTGASFDSIPTTIATFDGSAGQFPTGTLVVDSSGSLIGTTQAGGNTGAGTVFELSRASGTYASTTTILADLNSTDGAVPFGGVIVDAAGNLLGTAASGGATNDGTVFEIAKNDHGYAETPVTVVSFGDGNGSAPTGGLILDDAGDLFGTTQQGGTSGLGVVFEVPYANGAYLNTPITLASFNGTDGESPMGSLAMDANGDLFGTTRAGGLNGEGTVFELPKTTTGYADTPTTLVSFATYDGQSPEGSLTIDATGSLFGTTSQGGTTGQGTVFEIARTDQGYAPAPVTLINFDGTDGAFPAAGLIADADGNLYGTTVGEGTPDNAGTVFELADTGFRAICYAEGTHLLTPHGEREIESLRPGDLVLTVSDGFLTPRRLKWIGSRLVDLVRSVDTEGLSPICLSKDAVAPSKPHRDLLVSPDHAILLDDKLICARQLVNGTTIYQVAGLESIKYFHVQFECHAIVVAEGLAAESYIDTGNSGFFANADMPNLYPASPKPAADTRRDASCAPFVSDEAIVRPVWEALACRAADLGKPVSRPVTTLDPGLVVLLGTRELKPIGTDASCVTFFLPGLTRQVRLVSRAQRPTAARPWLDDSRRLGVRVARMILRTEDDLREIPVDHPNLVEGWWGVERDGPDGVALRRWTDGNALLPLPEIQGVFALEIRLGGQMIYVLEPIRTIDRTLEAA